MNERGKLYSEVRRNRGAGKPVVENHLELKFRLGVFKLIVAPETKVFPPPTHQPVASVFQDSTQLLSPMLSARQPLPLVHPWLPTTVQFSAVQSLSHVQLFEIPWMQHAMLPCPSPTPGAYSTSCPSCLTWSVRQSNHLILCRPLLLPPSIFPSIRVFPSESVLPIRWPKYWSFSFSFSMFHSILPMNIQG